MTSLQVAHLLAEHDIPVGSRNRIIDPERPEQSLLDHRDQPENAQLGWEAGALTARLHALPTDDGAACAGHGTALPAASIGERIPAYETLRASLPSRSGRKVRAVLDAIGARLHEAPHDGSLLHGRLVPDLIAVQPGPGSAGRVQLTSLERSGAGPDGADLGTWLARCRTARSPELADAFLAGYASLLELPDEQELGAWTARALLLWGLDPQHLADGESADSRFGLAETVLDGGVLAAR